MITPELITYIRGEIAKGRTREEIHTVLSSGGGWSEVDISEAFRSVIPIQSFDAPSTLTPSDAVSSTVKNESKSKIRLKVLIFVLLVLAGIASWYFFSPQIIGFWNGGINKLSELFVPLFNKQVKTSEPIVNTLPQNNQAILPEVNIVKDCGTTNSPDLKNTITYQNNSVLNCLGSRAMACEPAKAVLKDTLFPTIFEITKNQNTCNFRLSYGADSTLIDKTGKKLALQYISCPVSIVKAISENKNTLSFNSPNTDNPSKYASQIYFYGILGLFLENNVEQNKILSLGCTGDYIGTVLAGYRNTQSQN